MVATDYVIEPPKRLVTIDWKELWHYRDLFVALTWRDISVRYKQTALGVLWALLQPVATMVVFTLVFNRMASIQSGDGTPYPIFLLIGTLLWQFYSGTITRASDSMVSNAPMIQKVYFPRLIVPATAAIVGLVDMAIASVVLAGMMVWYGFAPRVIGVALLPVLVITAFLSSLGLGMFMASLNIKYRDVRYALPFIVQILMYVTPVIYPVRMLDKYPVAKTLMLWANPMSGVISNARAALLGRSAIDWGAIGISLLMGTLFFAAGLWYFRATERYFADVV